MQDRNSIEYVSISCVFLSSVRYELDCSSSDERCNLSSEEEQSSSYLTDERKKRLDAYKVISPSSSRSGGEGPHSWSVSYWEVGTDIVEGATMSLRFELRLKLNIGATLFPKISGKWGSNCASSVKAKACEMRGSACWISGVYVTTKGTPIDLLLVWLLDLVLSRI